MAQYHVFTSPIADGTDTNQVRPSNWNSAHQESITLGGNVLGNSVVSGTNIVYQGGNNLSLSGTGNTIVFQDGGIAKTSADQLYFPRAVFTSPNGFPDRTQVSLSWSDATRTFTIAPTGASYDVWSNSVKYTKNSLLSIQISNTQGVHFIYFDDAGNLVETTTFTNDIILRWGLVSIVYWDATNSKSVPDAQIETHGVDWPSEVHLQQHVTVGVRYQDGILAYVNAEQDGSLDSHIEVATSLGHTWDEDIQHTFPARLLSDSIPILSRTGANGWEYVISSGPIVRTGISGIAAYNYFNGSVWTQAEMTDTYFGVAYLYAMPSLTASKRLIIVQGQTQYASQAEAGNAALQVPELGAMPLNEMKLIAAIVFQTNSGYTNSVKSRIVRVGDVTGPDYVDWRYQSAIQVAVAGSGVQIQADNFVYDFGIVPFGNANGVSFKTSNGSIVGSYDGLRNPSLALTNLSGTTASNSAGFTLSLSANVGGGGGAGNVIGVNGVSVGSTGTIQFNNSNNVSFGLNGSTVTASASQSQQPMAYSAANGNITANTLVFANSNGVSFSTGTQGLYATVATNYAASNVTTNNVALSQSGLFQQTSATSNITSNAFPSANTTKFAGTGTSATNASITMNSNGLAISVANPSGITNINVSAGTTSNNLSALQFANSNGVTFGLNGSTVTASITPAGGAQTAISGISAGTTQMTSGTAVFGNANNVSFGVNGNTLTASVSQSQQPMYYSAANGNTSANTLVFANSNGVSFSTGTQGVYATVATNYQSQGAYLTTARASNDAIGLNSALTANGLSVTANSSGLSINMPAFDYASATTKYAGTGTTFGGANVSGSMTLNSNGLNLSLSANPGGNTLTVSAANGTLQSNALTFANSNGVSFSTGTQGIYATVATNYQSQGAYLTTARASNDAIGTNTALTANGLAVTANSSGLSINMPAFEYASHTTVFAGTGTTFAGTNVSGSVTLNSNGLNLALSAPTPGGGAAINVSAGTTSNNLQTLQFANSNGVSFGLNGSTITASAAGGAGDGYNIISIGGNTAGTTNTYQSATMMLAGGPSITMSQSSNSISINAPAVSVLSALTNITIGTTGSTIGFSAGGGNTLTVSAANGTLQSNALTFANSNGVSFSTGTQGIYATVATNYQSQGAYLTTARASNDAIGTNTALTANGVSVTANSSGLSLNFPAFDYASATTKYAGTGTTFAGTNVSGSITLNSNGLNLALSAPTPGGGAAINVSAGTTSGNLQTIQFANSNGVSFGLNGSTITASASGGGGVLPMFLSYQNRQLGASGSTQFTNNQLWMIPFRVAGGSLSGSTIQYIQSLSGTYTSAVAATHAQTMNWCIYQQNSTASSQMDSLSSGSLTWQIWNSGTSSASWAMNGSTSSSAGTGILTQIGGVRMMDIPLNATVGSGLYMMAFAASSSTAGYSGLLTRYGVVVDNPMPLAMGLRFGSATATSIGYGDAGTYSVTSAAFPSTVSLSQVLQHSNLVPYFKIGAL